MKKYIFPFIIILSPFFAKAQTIGYLDLPVAGELWIEFKDTVAANINITPSGTGQTWNYLSSFNVHDTILFHPMAISTVPANIASLYPQSNLVNETEVAGDYSFYRTSFAGNGGMFLDGMHSDVGFDIAGFNVNDINYTNDLLYIPIPFEYGNGLQNTAYYDYTYPDPVLFPSAVVRVTYSTFQDMEAEAQGQLTTPLGNYASTIRIKEVITENVLYEMDSFALGNFTYLTDMTYPSTYAYKWLKSGPNCVVMTATLNEFNNVTEASYYTSSGLVNTKSIANESTITLMPNPVNQGNSLTFTTNNNNLNSLRVYDLSGRELYQMDINKGSSLYSIPTEKFETGLYYLKAYSNNEVQSVTKFVVTK